MITGFSVVQAGRRRCRWALPWICVTGSPASSGLVKQALHLHYWHQLITTPIGWPSCLLPTCVSSPLKLWLYHTGHDSPVSDKVVCSAVQLGKKSLCGHKPSYTDKGQTVKYDKAAVAVLTLMDPLPIYISQRCAVWTGGRWSLLSSPVSPTSEYRIELAHV